MLKGNSTSSSLVDANKPLTALISDGTDQQQVVVLTITITGQSIYKSSKPKAIEAQTKNKCPLAV